jgi:hypothetical protein
LNLKSWNANIRFKLHKDNSTWANIPDYLILEGKIQKETHAANGVFTATILSTFNFAKWDSAPHIANNTIFWVYHAMDNAWCIPSTVDVQMSGTSEADAQQYLTVEVHPKTGLAYDKFKYESLTLYTMIMEIGYDYTDYNTPMVIHLNTDYWHSVSDKFTKGRDFVLTQNQLDSDYRLFSNVTSSIKGYEVADVISDTYRRTGGSTTGKFLSSKKYRAVHEIQIYYWANAQADHESLAVSAEPYFQCFRSVLIDPYSVRRIFSIGLTR